MTRAELDARLPLPANCRNYYRYKWLPNTGARDSIALRESYLSEMSFDGDLEQAEAASDTLEALHKLEHAEREAREARLILAGIGRQKTPVPNRQRILEERRRRRQRAA